MHQSAQALKQNNIIEFGQLMNASHESLMNDYEVTGLELDTIYLESIAFSGVVGCRMTGAGLEVALSLWLKITELKTTKPTSQINILTK